MTIRQTPDDFLVIERLDPVYRDALTPRHGPAHTHAVYELRKTSLNTQDALAYFARSLHLAPGVIDYAGLKDKHARTTQHLSFPTHHLKNNDPPPHTAGPNWSAKHLGYAAEPMTAAAILGNRFRITLRALSKSDSDAMDIRAKLLTPSADAASSTPSLLITNYFGSQRFGSARHGQGWVGKHLLLGEFETALKLAIATPTRKDAGKTRQFTRLAATHWGDWPTLLPQLPRLPERRAIETLARGGSFRDAFESLPYFLQAMSVEAYQSHLWNDTVRRLIRKLHADSAATPPPPLLRTHDPFGEMLFPPAAIIHEPWASLAVPLLARQTPLLAPYDEATRQTLAAEHITQQQLRIPGLRRPFFGQAMRPLFVRAENFTLSPPERDDLASPSSAAVKRTAAFDLPRGAYATVALRALGQ